MKVGLLGCDHVRTDLQHIAGDYQQMFATLFPAMELVAYDVCQGQFPLSVLDCDAYICTGSKYSVYDDLDWIRDLQDFVRELYAREKVYVGVCFGHQLLGEVLGGKVEKSPNGWCVGAHTFAVNRPESWMTPFQSDYRLLMMCQDQIVVLPPDSTVLATTPACAVGMFSVGPRMLGLQAHPEFPLAYERALLQDRVTRIGAEKVSAALESLVLPLDAGMIGEWLVNFIEQAHG